MADEKALAPIDNATKFLEAGGNIENLEKMMELQERWESNQARKAFNESMTEAQKNMPIVPKDKKNQQTGSMYSKHETIIMFAKPVYTAAGFSLMFYEAKSEKENYIKVMVDIRHEKGHMETRYVDLPVDVAGIKGSVNKTGIHGAGSTMSYGRRYLTCMLFNIPTGDDTDGNQTPVHPVKKTITPDKKVGWKKAKDAYIRDGNFQNVLKHAIFSEENQKKMLEEIELEKSESGGQV